jgi:hypothetical protein
MVSSTRADEGRSEFVSESDADVCATTLRALTMQLNMTKAAPARFDVPTFFSPVCSQSGMATKVTMRRKIGNWLGRRDLACPGD